MSLGIAHDAPVPPDATHAARFWPIDVYWICQGPWFQCWVLWRKGEGTAGHVTILVLTPAARGLPLASQITRPIPARNADGQIIPNSPPAIAASPDYASPPEKPSPAPPREQLPCGMWVVGHEDHYKDIIFSTERTRIGEILPPTLGWRAVDRTTVKCVAPAEWEGGVLDQPRKYMAPSGPIG
jgi:hypothetical protein